MNEISINYNPSPAVRRILMEAKELQESTEEYYARPLEDNIFEWHFTIRGARDSVFSNGLYHGRIILPTDYPYKPPSIIFLTPNGRFKTNQKICLSISGYHPETWLPSWSIRTALLAMIQFMPTPGDGHIGAINYNDNERKLLAFKSHKWKCDHCGDIVKHLKPRTQNNVPQNNDIDNSDNQVNSDDDNNRIEIQSSQSPPQQDNDVQSEEIDGQMLPDETDAQEAEDNHNLVEPQPPQPVQQEQPPPPQHEQLEPIRSFVLYSILLVFIGFLIRRLDLYFFNN